MSAKADGAHGPPAILNHSSGTRTDEGSCGGQQEPRTIGGSEQVERHAQLI